MCKEPTVHQYSVVGLVGVGVGGQHILVVFLPYCLQLLVFQGLSAKYRKRMCACYLNIDKHVSDMKPCKQSTKSLADS